MTGHNIIVIGASAGGVESLRSLVSMVPRDIPAALFVVLHLQPYARSFLPEILSRSGPLPAAHAVNREPIRPGRIYVAPPNQHLLVRRDYVEVTGGPRENHSRPAVDPLFRTAARAYGQRVVGVILSGALYDGVAGLMAVKGRGGIAVVQDPADALVDGMPRNALQLIDADYVAAAEEIAAILNDLARRPINGKGRDMAYQEEPITTVIAEDFHEQANGQRGEETTVYTCPDCGGVLWQEGSGRLVHFRCHVGHAFAPEMLLGMKSDEVEAALWTSVRLLKEKATLTQQLATRSRASGNISVAERAEEQAQAIARQADLLRELVEALPETIDVEVTAD